MIYFDTECDGHHPHHLAVLARHIIRNDLQEKIVFAVPKQLQERALAEYDNGKGMDRSGLHFSLLDATEVSRIKHTRDIWKRHWRLWRLGIKTACDLGGQTVFFAVMDDVLMAAAFSWPPLVKVSGLIFRGSLHYPEFRKGLKGVAIQGMKSLYFQWALSRGHLTTLFTLDPYLKEYSNQRIFHGEKVKFLPEPYDSSSYLVSLQCRKRAEVKFLFYGIMQQRKGVRQLVEALALLPQDIRGCTIFRFCGEGPMVPFIEERLPALREAGVKLTLLPRYMTEKELEDEISNADGILAPYLNHVGSSGILLTSASYRKPIISQRVGMIGREIRKYRLGEAVDTLKPQQIADAIKRVTEKIIAGGCTDADFEGFLRPHGEEAYARTLIENM